MLLNASSFYVSLSPKTLKHNMSTRLRALSKATDSKGNPVSRSYPCVDQVSSWFEGTLVSGFYPNRNSRFYLFFCVVSNSKCHAYFSVACQGIRWRS